MGDGVAINVVPAREQDFAGVRDGREPFADVVERKDAQIGAVGVHPVQRVAVPAVAEARREAARVAPPPRGHERDAAIGQVARHHVVVAAARELAQTAAVHVDLVDVEIGALIPLFVHRHLLRGERLRRARHVGEHDPLAIVGKARFEKVAGGQLAADDVADGERTPRLLQHEQAAAGPLPPAEILRDQVAPTGRHTLAQQQLVEVQQRVAEDDLAFEQARLDVEPAQLRQVGTS